MGFFDRKNDRPGREPSTTPGRERVSDAPPPKTVPPGPPPAPAAARPGIPREPLPRPANPEPQLGVPAKRNLDDHWRLKFRIALQGIRDKKNAYTFDDSPYNQGFHDGMCDAGAVLLDMLGETEEEMTR